MARKIKIIKARRGDRIECLGVPTDPAYKGLRGKVLEITKPLGLVRVLPDNPGRYRWKMFGDTVLLYPESLKRIDEEVE